MSKPFISVIMPVRNAGLFVVAAVDSILQQSFTDFELIIVDDASTDDTRLKLNLIEDTRIMRLYNRKHTGNYKCRNQALEVAKGKYISVMDGDDIASPEKILKQCDFMEKHPEYMATGTDIEFFSEDSKISTLERLRNPEEIKVHLLKDNVCTHPTLMIKREVFCDHKIRYNEDYFYSADYDLIL
ncbi:MAG: glycosyltransferase family 2 protein, partial [Dysgonamonadaceae bacterium]|nr:glycosyltransferase family 2 protein [Dysgonamonadaceae bacterium]